MADSLRDRCVAAACARDLAIPFGEPYGGGIFGLAADVMIPLVEQDTAERIAAWLELLGSHDNGGMPALYDVVELAGGVRSGVWKDRP